MEDRRTVFLLSGWARAAFLCVGGLFLLYVSYIYIPLWRMNGRLSSQIKEKKEKEEHSGMQSMQIN
jgi:uncharacterized hydantoinase/oxoprolinase family protein